LARRIVRVLKTTVSLCRTRNSSSEILAGGKVKRREERETREGKGGCLGRKERRKGGGREERRKGKEEIAGKEEERRKEGKKENGGKEERRKERKGGEEEGKETTRKEGKEGKGKHTRFGIKNGGKQKFQIFIFSAISVAEGFKIRILGLRKKLKSFSSEGEGGRRRKKKVGRRNREGRRVEGSIQKKSKQISFREKKKFSEKLNPVPQTSFHIPRKLKNFVPDTQSPITTPKSRSGVPNPFFFFFGD
jgi:hypothetical protein